ncbi:metallophosphoesterase [Nitratiruptor sp. SB155-2]|uniref:metallophosphoesterase n=1 Tax=Nitratiruptor sp. (strain SB155-2) TaxID=387092 RepID=UPI0001586DAC|nr:metallophosphoesterase [Nitratiruptor sp. SB155-2]BAF69395.1 conserved hypothetical protein [Nitratiruptor sp. SB155-2]
MSRLIVYGDIHGCLDELCKLREMLSITEEDEEYCVGDVINKGPYSLETLRYVKEKNIRCVRGNHEDKLLRYHHHEMERITTSKPNPMHLSQKELEVYRSMEREDFLFLQSFPLFIQKKRLTIIHAGVLPSTNLYALDKKEAAKVMRVRYLDEKGNFVVLDKSEPKKHFWWSSLYDGRFGYIVYGHQPFLTPRVDRFSFGIDTGAVYGNRLTAIVFDQKDEVLIESYRFVSVDAKAYAKKGKAWIVGDL